MWIKNLLAMHNATGWTLIFSSTVLLVGVMMYGLREFWVLPGAGGTVYVRLERSLIIAAMLAAAAGLTRLAGILRGAGDPVFAPAGLAMVWIGTAAVIGAEIFSLLRHQWVTVLVNLFVVLAFLGQAVVGVSILRTGLLPVWIGWAAVLWNLGWLAVLPIASPKDWYYPILHFAALIPIGIALLK